MKQLLSYLQGVVDPSQKTGSLEIPLSTNLRFAHGLHESQVWVANCQVLLLGSGVSYPCRRKQATAGCCVELPRKSTLQFPSDHISLRSEAPCIEVCEFLVSNPYLVEPSVARGAEVIV